MSIHSSSLLCSNEIPIFHKKEDIYFSRLIFQFQIVAFQILSKQKVQFFIVTAIALKYEPETPNDLFLMVFEEVLYILKTWHKYLFGEHNM